MPSTSAMPHLGAIKSESNLSLISLNRLAMGDKWRTEAMRSYESPVLIWFTRGQGRITAAGVTYGYGPNNAVFLPANTMFGFEMLGAVQGQMLILPLESRLDWPGQVQHLRLRDARSQAELTQAISELEREMEQNAPAKERAIFHRLGLLSVLLFRLYQSQSETAPKARASQRIARAYSDLVEKDFTSGKPVSDYAAALGVTPTHLSRACRAANGKTAHQILADRRLFEARKRLIDEGDPVATIASDLGFGSPAYFTRIFRASTGQTPTEFRNMH